MLDYGRANQVLGARLRLGEGVSGIAAASGEPFMIEDHRTWPSKAEVFRASTTGRVLAVPLKTQGRTLGVLYLSDEAAGKFDEDEIRLATLFAEQAAIAIHNARMFDETRRYSEQMEALYQTAVEISSQSDLDLLLAAVVDRATGVLGLPVGGLYLLDEKTQELEMVVSRYPDRDYVGHADCRRRGRGREGSRAGRTVRRRELCRLGGQSADVRRCPPGTCPGRAAARRKAGRSAPSSSATSSAASSRRPISAW